MHTADWLRTIVFRVRKQWDYCCHVLICMVKTIVRSLRFTLTEFTITVEGSEFEYFVEDSWQEADPEATIKANRNSTTLASNLF